MDNIVYSRKFGNSVYVVRKNVSNGKYFGFEIQSKDDVCDGKIEGKMVGHACPFEFDFEEGKRWADRMWKFS